LEFSNAKDAAQEKFSADCARDGKWHAIKIEVDQPGADCPPNPTTTRAEHSHENPLTFSGRGNMVAAFSETAESSHELPPSQNSPEFGLLIP